MTKTTTRKLLISAMVLLATATTLAAPTYSAGDSLDSIRGTIVHVRGDWYGIVPVDDPGTRFAPDSLPEPFRSDGLQVIFSGTVGETPPNVRLWGIPLQLTAVRRAEE